MHKIVKQEFCVCVDGSVMPVPSYPFRHCLARLRKMGDVILAFSLFAPMQSHLPLVVIPTSLHYSAELRGMSRSHVIDHIQYFQSGNPQFTLF